MSVYRLGQHGPDLPPKDEYWIAPSAAVLGQVRLGQDVSVWFGATIRGDNEPITIGEGTNIQEKATLHVDPGFPMTVGPGSTIGHNSVIHGCTIGPGSLVGMGATILNGARIGANCLVGANALVTEGRQFDDGSLIVGTPAKSLRKLRDEEVAAIKQATEDYVNRWRYYARELVPLPE